MKFSPIRTLWSLGAVVLVPAVLAAPAHAQTTGAAPAATASAAARETPYRINAGDEIEIYVWGEERLQRRVKVLPDGTVAFPLVGQVVAQGLLPTELQRVISQGLSGQYRGEVPQVTVSVVSPAGMQFSIMGRVRSPGSFTPGRYVNVLEALSLAGGPNEFANLNDIVILRKQGQTVRAIPVRLGSLFRTGANSNDVDRADLIRIESGDTVIVP